jgi:hypothetical protein
MPKRWEEVKAWRERAKGLQRLAESVELSSAKEGLLQTARNYDRMADDLERRLRHDGV